jgi:hypothetical protein
VRPGSDALPGPRPIPRSDPKRPQTMPRRVRSATPHRQRRLPLRPSPSCPLVIAVAADPARGVGRAALVLGLWRHRRPGGGPRDTGGARRSVHPRQRCRPVPILQREEEDPRGSPSRWPSRLGITSPAPSRSPHRASVGHDAGWHQGPGERSAAGTTSADGAIPATATTPRSMNLGRPFHRLAGSRPALPGGPEVLHRRRGQRARKSPAGCCGARPMDRRRGG